MSVDHRRADIAVPQELLDRSNVGAVLEQMGGERVPQGVARGGFPEAGALDGGLEGLLEHGFVQVVATFAACHRIPIKPRRGKDPLPSPLPRRARILRSTAVGSSTLPRPRARSR